MLYVWLNLQIRSKYKDLYPIIIINVLIVAHRFVTQLL